MLIKSQGERKYKGFLLEKNVQQFFAGRLWKREMAPFPPWKVNLYIRKGWLQVRGAIEEGPRCSRCHHTKHFIVFDCNKCQAKCVYCRHCINMGRMSQCTELLTWCGPLVRPLRNHILDWQSQFTPLQARASQELAESMRLKRQHLLHACCGAGKTEILFTAIYAALKRGERVCVATPRTDVVLELAPRFQQVFPQTTIHALYGGADVPHSYAPLIVTTTHQLYRFEDAFDVMIVDEADAFPYTFDEALQKAVQKAKRVEAPIAFVTATPSGQLLQMKKAAGSSYIPKRYHDRPLPVPRFESLWRYDKQLLKNKIPKKLETWLKSCIADNQPFLIFFPTIELMTHAIPLFQVVDEKIEAVYAEDTERKEKVLQLRNGQLKGLLTTTILERGITIKGVQVAVVGAESAIFTAAALIQISGRVGRHIHFAEGDVVFFHHGITTEMDAAREEIMKLNKEGFPYGTGSI